METLLEILKYTLPGLIVLLTTYIILKSFLENETEKQLIQLKQSNTKALIPLKMQAYERFVLFLERILPENLILRVSRPEYTALQLKMAMIKSIREEYEHNMSQQLYISDSTWRKIKEAKEEMIHLINTCGGDLDDRARGTELAADVLQVATNKKPVHVKEAILVLKNEFNEMF